jgi:UDP-N-acetylmuramate--alanine ligase
MFTQNLQPGDICLFLGAGNLNQIIPGVIAFYETTLSPQQPENVV